MASDQEPLVSVVTPVYNGASYLSECIESVLSQEYENWEYVIVNNSSTDETLAIAERYASREPRIHVHHNSEFLPLVQNWNLALRQLSPSSKYWKIVCADDFLYPECLRRMVAFAERHPSAGIVSAYSLYGSRVELDGLPHFETVIPGREICRRVLMRQYRTFGCPTAMLFRADPTRTCERFFDENAPQPDRAACYEVLQDSDFGFIHQVLSFTRVHDESVTSTVANRLFMGRLADLYLMKNYGPVYLSAAEYEELWKVELRRYYATLARGLTGGRGGDFWAYHRDALGQMGESLRVAKLAEAVVAHLGGRLLNPGTFAAAVFRRLRPGNGHGEAKRL